MAQKKLFDPHDFVAPDDALELKRDSRIAQMLAEVATPAFIAVNMGSLDKHSLSEVSAAVDIINTAIHYADRRDDVATMRDVAEIGGLGWALQTMEHHFADEVRDKTVVLRQKLLRETPEHAAVYDMPKHTQHALKRGNVKTLEAEHAVS